MVLTTWVQCISEGQRPLLHHGLETGTSPRQLNMEKSSQGLWNTVSCLRRKKTLTRRTVTRGNRRAKCSRTGKICVHILPRRRLRQERSGWSRTRDNRPAFKRQRRAAIRSTGCVLGLGEDTSQQAKRGNGTPVSSLVQVVCINTCPACQLFVS